MELNEKTASQENTILDLKKQREEMVNYQLKMEKKITVLEQEKHGVRFEEHLDSLCGHFRALRRSKKMGKPGSEEALANATEMIWESGFNPMEEEFVDTSSEEEG